MAVVVNLTPTYPLALGGYTFPGYTALHNVILNLVLAIVLTPLFNAMNARDGRRSTIDETVAADCHA
jgi:SSS family solute:Na+ symporter